MRKRNVILFVVFLAVAVLIVVGFILSLSFGWIPGLGSRQGTPFNPLPELEIQVVYATEEGQWMQDAARRFNEEGHVLNSQRIVVELIPMDSVEALAQIRDGKLQPTAWSPASMLWVNTLNNEWLAAHATDLVMRVGQYQATPLVLSPMVFVMWEDRAQVYVRYFQEEPDWETIQRAVSAPEGWKSLGGDPNWGFVKFGQTDPVYSNSGLVAASLATYSYYEKQRGLSPQEITHAEYQAWITPLWRSVVGGYDRTSADLMANMIRYGPSTYDVIMVYENLAASQLKNAEGRWGSNLRIYYPRYNLWNDHPFCVLLADWSSADQKDAALEFQKYLLGEEVQRQALHYGFRPANVDVAIVNDDPENLFNRHQDLGLLVKIPRINLVEVPSAETLNALEGLFLRQR